MNENKRPFALGILVGRFQTFHTGHEDMINKALAVCEKVGIFVGSSQESGTSKNPFTYETREKTLKTVFGDRVDVFPLPDIGVGNNSKWGDYVLENVKSRYGTSPSLLVSGKETRRIDWFDSSEGVTVAELYIPKTIDISATKMREYLINNYFEEWKKYTPKPLWNSFGELREIMLAAKDNDFTQSI